MAALSQQLSADVFSVTLFIIIALASVSLWPVCDGSSSSHAGAGNRGSKLADQTDVVVEEMNTGKAARFGCRSSSAEQPGASTGPWPGLTAVNHRRFPLSGSVAGDTGAMELVRVAVHRRTFAEVRDRLVR